LLLTIEGPKVGTPDGATSTDQQIAHAPGEAASVTGCAYVTPGFGSDLRVSEKLFTRRGELPSSSLKKLTARLVKSFTPASIPTNLLWRRLLF
jgi:hypothetical protein